MHQVPDGRRRRAAELARVRPKRQLALGLIVPHNPAIKNENTGRPRCHNQRDRDKLLQVSPIQSAANCPNERHDCNHSPKSAKSQKARLMQGRCIIGHRAFSRVRFLPQRAVCADSLAALGRQPAARRYDLCYGRDRLKTEMRNEGDTVGNRSDAMSHRVFVRPSSRRSQTQSNGAPAGFGRTSAVCGAP
jgi:hypothetical protein